ncbi:hypothetical protein [Gorillibacterium timonense]|uniref:hypothetical protein n=1 Tax=Gorillibacterium timonense TaxID=1689269 RepID=UPI00071D4222|nr:hypothetical protein [Gorillibacterium timonense]
MFGILKKGWSSAWSQPFVLAVLFLYRFAWAFALFRIAKSHVVPLLARYPDSGGPSGGAQLFLMEAQFRLAKTDLAAEYVGGLLLLLGIRMLITPLLNAGIFYSLTHTQLNTGYRFFKGLKRLGPAFTLYYAARMALTLLPLLWIYPHVRSLNELYSLASNPNKLLLYALVYAAYGYLIHLLFLHLQFGHTERQPFLRTLIRSLSSALPVLGTALLLITLSVLLSAGVLAAALWDAGLWTFLLYQGYTFVRTFLSLWGITSQHQVFRMKSEPTF